MQKKFKKIGEFWRCLISHGCWIGLERISHPHIKIKYLDCLHKLAVAGGYNDCNILD